MKERRVVVPLDLDGVRVDRVIASELSLSRTRVREIIDNGGVTRDGVPVKPGDRFPAGSALIVDVPDIRRELEPEEDVPFTVVYEDGDVIVVDKPIGVVVHPGSGSATGTLANGLLARFPELRGVGQEDRWGIVHRLDRDTSGLLVVARTDVAYEFLVDLMREREISRRYLSLVSGVITNTTGTIDAPVGRDPGNPTRMCVTRSGRPAVTHYRRLAQWTHRNAVLLSISLETGRTHQIRVHMNAIGTPIIGDTVYGRRGVVGDPGRPWLHARQLSFTHPTTGRDMDFLAQLPVDLCDSLEVLGAPDVGAITDVEGIEL
jgi:23S rRNA pseudouridine1911/1915/1917 synthase